MNRIPRLESKLTFANQNLLSMHFALASEGVENEALWPEGKPARVVLCIPQPVNQNRKFLLMINE